MKIFLSYRRNDSAGYAGRLRDSLCARLRRSHVFLDRENVGPGDEFEETVVAAAGSHDVLIAVIGPDWLSPRLEDPGDLVRRELLAALEQTRRVVPVLVGGATMPTAEELPKALAPLAGRSPFAMSDARWDYDVESLVRSLRRRRPWWIWLLVAAALIVVAVVAGTVRDDGHPPAEARLVRPLTGTLAYGDEVAVDISGRRRDQAVWLLTRYENATFQPCIPPTKVAEVAEDRWVTNVFAGDEGDREKEFTVFVVLADREASDLFQETRLRAAFSEVYPGLDQLPPGATTIGTFTFVRT